MRKNYVKLATATADNSAATVDFSAGSTNAKIYLTAVGGSFSDSAHKLLTVADGGVTKGNYHVKTSRDVVYDPPLEIQDSCTVSLAASGTGGIIGAVSVAYFTV